MKKIRMFCLVAVICVAASMPVMADDDPILASVGDYVIRLSDFNRIVDYYTVEQQEAIRRTPGNNLKLLRKLVQEKILSADARNAGLDKDRAVKEQIKIMTDGQLTSEFLVREVAAKVRVSDEDARNYYELHKADYKTPETVRARHILVKTTKDADQESKKAAKQRSESLLKRIRDGESFEKLADESTEDLSGKGKGGDLGFFPRGKMVPEFDKAVFGLKSGEVSDIVETRFGYHIIKLEEIKAAGVLPFEESRQRIIEKVLKETRAGKIKEYVEKRMADEKAEFYPDRFPKQ